ncbi:MAG: hypothetical protein MUE98_00585 [Rhodobacteraceae bacterium]|jgi:hypothetical protein|nr:hypothetical protein [Paracoccaceae bacterium]
MPAARASLKQADLTRYAKAMRAAGIADWRVEIEPSGKVVIVAGSADDATGPNPCDRLLK